VQGKTQPDEPVVDHNGELLGADDDLPCKGGNHEVTADGGDEDEPGRTRLDVIGGLDGTTEKEEKTKENPTGPHDPEGKEKDRVGIVNDRDHLASQKLSKKLREGIVRRSQRYPDID
jgi:hypothetical protein